MHEASLYKANCFVTLTYDDQHLPHRGQLEYPDFQKFMKRLRKTALSGVRFYMCGEYGPTTWRPHFHACLFNYDFPDRVYWGTGESGEKTYTSETLAKLWPFGFTLVGDVTFESAAYVARYCVQKVTGKAADAHYRRTDAEGTYQLRPEFNKMSLKPGIGADWYKFYKADVYPHDYTVVRTAKCKPPKYYDKLLKREEPDTLAEIKERREQQAAERQHDNTWQRLKAKETVQQARANMLKRTIE